MLLRWLFLFWMNRNLCDFIHWLPLLLYFCCFLIHPDSCVATYLNTFWHRFWWVGKKSKICVFSSSCFLSPTVVYSPRPQCCITYSSSSFIPTWPLKPLSTSLWKSKLLFMRSSSCFRVPSICLSTLMRSRMTMNTPIIMRKQQALPPPPPRPPLPNLGPPTNR